ncbi:ubiquinol-cytochrome c reductase iron-sulfur subunit [Meiothermus ruber]|uniref:QcrA and Rieske domain-containing protein n=1 Tax=Meiothermus ruber TaxID=277 RepID=UPI0003464080|nr:Rieske (2Fe-2S) protein [Meiothermus ruber]GAO75235.1 Rieske (2Fe-2S) iron-sulfur domain protein [Meiothermus ruber H328]
MHKPQNTVKTRLLKRREALQAGLGACAGLLLGRTLAQANSLVAAGDVLVYASGDKADQPILVNQVGLNKALNAYPMDPSNQMVKKDLKTLIVLVRLDPKTLDANTAKYAANGFVAYSAICTHQGCPINQLGEVGSRKGKLVCTCHGAVYDPTAGAKVLGGQAKRPLALLPLKLQGQNLVAAGGFIGKVGAD